MKLLRTGDVLDPGVTLRSGVEPEIVVSDATLIPGEKVPGVNAYRGGIVDSSGEEIMAGRLVRGEGITVLGNPRVDAIDANNVSVAYGSYRYAGAFTWHYGHFLLEGLGRISKRGGPERSVPHLFHDFTRGKAVPHVQFFLSCLGVSAIPVSFPLRIRGELIVPPSRLVIKRSVHEDQALIYREIASSVLSREKDVALSSGGALYLSRSRLKKDKRPRRMVNEAALEEALAGVGIAAVHMQELRIEEQIGLVARARLIIGPLGSAMHSTVFAAQDCRVLYLGHEKPNQNFPMLDSLCGRSAMYCIFDQAHGDKYNWKIDIDALMRHLLEIDAVDS